MLAVWSLFRCLQTFAHFWPCINSYWMTTLITFSNRESNRVCMNRMKKERERDDHLQKNKEKNHHFIGNSDFSCRALLFLQLSHLCARASEWGSWLSRCSIRSSFWSPLPKWKTDYNDWDARTYARTKENSIKISRFDVKFIMRSVINRWLKMVIDKAFGERRSVTLATASRCYCMNIGCVRASAHRATTTHILSAALQFNQHWISVFNGIFSFLFDVFFLLRFHFFSRRTLNGSGWNGIERYARTKHKNVASIPILCLMVDFNAVNHNE